MPDAAEPARLFLVAPDRVDGSFAPQLEAALSTAHVAAVLFHAASVNGNDLAPLVSIVQSAGAAALIANDTRLAGHLKADGVHIGGGIEDLRLAVESFKPKRIVGVGSIFSRHDALEAGELDIDYVFFGNPYGDTHDAPHPKALALAEWFAEVTQIPAIVMAGRSLQGIDEAVATGAEFIALHHAIWSHEGGPAEAVRLAAARLQGAGRRAA